MLAIIGIVAAISLLRQKSLFKSAISLAILFAIVAGFMLLLGQNLVALFQLLVLVGGLSTYLVVAVATDKPINFGHVSLIKFGIAAVVLGAILTYAIGINSGQTFVSIPNISQEIGLAIGSGFGLIGAIVFLTFAVAIGSIMLIKRAVKMVV